MAQFHLPSRPDLFLQLSTLPGEYALNRSDYSREWWDNVEQVAQPRPVPERGIQKPGDDRDILTVDGFGQPLTWLPAGDFGHVYVADPEQPVVGSLAYIKAINPKTPVVLYWYES